MKRPLSIIKKSGLFLSAAMLLTATCHASELDPGFYAGFGLSNIEAEDSGASSDAIGATLIGGYTFSKYLSTEISLFDLGDQEELGIEGTGLTLSLIGSYPVAEKLSVFAELGAVSADIDVDESQNIANNTSGEASLESGRDSSIYVGIGAKYRLKDWALVIRATDADLDADVSILSAQVHYDF